MKLIFKKIDQKAVIPQYQHKGEDACFDLSVLIDSESNEPSTYSYDGFETKVGTYNSMVFIPPRKSVVFHTGLKCEIENGYVMRIYVRSSTGIKKGLMLSNGTGIIDSNYRGEIMLSLYNTTDAEIGVRSLDRLCQAEIAKVIDVDIYEATEGEELSETSRGEGGIGSTGNN